MSTSWALGCLYLVAYGAWARFFRVRVDPWVRRRLGNRLGANLGWVQATSFPLEVWVWGLSRRRQDADGSRLDALVALAGVAICLTAAFLPTATLCVLLSRSPRLSEELGPALYLTTPLLILLFAASHLGRREAEPLESGIDGRDTDPGSSSDRQRRSQPSASLDARRES